MRKTRLQLCVRLMLQRPSFVLLDEATSAIDHETAKRLYQLVREFAGNYVSVGLRADLEQYHEMVLELDGTGGWRIERGKTGQI